MRERSSVPWLETAWQDCRYTLRGLRRSPGFAVTAILSLALGIGASVAIFTVVDNVLLRPLPYRDPARLVMIWETNKRSLDTHVIGADRNSVAPANYFDWKAQSDVFETVAAFLDGTSILTYQDRAEELKRQAMTADLLPMLGVKPLRGRLFTAAEDRPGVTDPVIISYRIWRSWFGGDEGIIGRKVQMNSRPRTIIGVLPAGFYFRNRATDLWEPLGLNPRSRLSPDVGPLHLDRRPNEIRRYPRPGSGADGRNRPASRDGVPRVQ